MKITYSRKSFWAQLRLARQLQSYAMELLDTSLAHVRKANELSSRDISAAQKWLAAARAYREQAMVVRSIVEKLCDPKCGGFTLQLERKDG